MPITPSLRHCSNKYKLAREGEKDKDEDLEKVKVFFFLYSQVELKEMSSRLTSSEPNKFILVSEPQDMVPVIHVLSLLVFSKLFAGFLVHHL